VDFVLQAGGGQLIGAPDVTIHVTSLALEVIVLEGVTTSDPSPNLQ
jgi:hypothetical protein